MRVEGVRLVVLKLSEGTIDGFVDAILRAQDDWRALLFSPRFADDLHERSTAYTRYRHLAIKHAKPVPSETQLAAIENLLGAQLFASFRDYLRVANGGSVEYVIDVPYRRRQA